MVNYDYEVGDIIRCDDPGYISPFTIVEVGTRVRLEYRERGAGYSVVVAPKEVLADGYYVCQATRKANRIKREMEELLK